MPRIGGCVLVAVLCGGALAGTAEAASPGRDLVAASVSAPEWVVPEERFEGVDTVANRGRGRSQESVTRYFLAVGGRPRPVGRREVPALRGGASSQGAARLTLPAGVPDGQYRLWACADAHDDVHESDERNNCAATRVGVDTTSPPSPVIDANPSDPSGEADARFAFWDAEAGAGLLCRLDDGAFAACTSPFEVAELGEGTHRFEVKARDTAGNESATSAFAWTIDRTAPEPPVIDERPTATTISDRAHFAFTPPKPACGSRARWTTRSRRRARARGSTSRSARASIAST